MMNPSEVCIEVPRQLPIVTQHRPKSRKQLFQKSIFVAPLEQAVFNRSAGASAQKELGWDELA
ncbi:MAG: hypothetical protein A49_05620 [Methyloceanibacter sp.]|nr:MAG: hypothetical protein A49_05620 [Methyloceanibacter sp.]